MVVGKGGKFRWTNSQSHLKTSLLEAYWDPPTQPAMHALSFNQVWLWMIMVGFGANGMERHSYDRRSIPVQTRVIKCLS